jgi:PAS domain S-box-containing protein
MDPSQEDTVDGEKSAIENVMERLRMGLYSLLFALSKDTSHSLLWVGIEDLSEFFQLLSFPFNAIVRYPWSSRMEWMYQLCTIFMPETLIVNSDVALYLALCFIGIVLLNSVVIGYYFSTNRYKFMWTLIFLRTASSLAVTILFIPFVALFTHKVTICHDEQGNYASCWKGSLLIRSIVLVIIGGTYLLYTFILALTFYEQDPRAKTIRSRPHSRIEVLYIGIRAILIILYVVYHDKEYQWFLMGVTLALTLIGYFLYIWYIPYYHFNYAVVRASMMGIPLWASLCLFVVLLTNNASTDDTDIVFLVGIPLVCLSTLFLLKSRRSHISKQPVEKLKSPYQVELKARITLENANILFIPPSKTYADNPNAAKQILFKVNEFYIASSKIFSDSSILHLFWAYYYLFFLENRHMAMTSFGRVEEREPHLDEEFIIYRRRKMLSESFSGGNLDVLSFITYEKHSTGAARYERKAVSYQVSFWSELSKQYPNIERLHKFGSAVSHAITTAKLHYEQMMKLNPNSPQVLRSYANFLANELNDHTGALQITQRAEEVEESKIRTGKNIETDLNVALFDDENAVIMISGESDKEGIILNVNVPTTQIFGFKKSEMVGKNVSMLLPPPFAEIHNQLIRAYMDTGYGKVIDRTRPVIARNKAGFIAPMYLCVRQFSQGVSGTAFLGILKPVEERNREEYFVLNSSGHIIALSLGCCDIFGTKPEDLLDSSIPATAWFPNFDKEQDTILQTQGLLFDQTISDIKYRFRLSAEVITIMKRTVMIVRFKSTQVNEDFNSKDKMNFMNEMVLAFHENDSTTSSVSRVSLRKGSSHEEQQEEGVVVEVVSFKAREDASNEDKEEEKDKVQNDQKDQKENPEGQQEGNQEIIKATGGVEEASSKGSEQSQNDMIRKVINQRDYEGEIRLRRLKRSFIALLCILGVLAIITQVAIYDHFINHVNRLSDIRDCGLGRFYATSLAYAARTLTLVSGGMISVIPNEYSAHFNYPLNYTEQAREQLSWFNEFDQNQELLYASLNNLSIARRSIYYNKSVLLNYPGGRSEYRNLKDATTFLTTAARSILQTPVPLLNQFQEDIVILLNNGFEDVLRKIDLATDVYQQEYEERITNVSPSLIAFAVTPFAVFLIVFLRFLHPITTQIENTKRQFLGLFMDIPKPVVKALNDGCLRRMEVYGDYNDDGSDPEDLEFEESMQSDYAADKEGEEEGEEHGIRKLLKKFHMRRDEHRVLGKVFMLVVLTGAFFLTLTITTYQFMNENTTIGAQVNWADRRRYLIKSINYFLREAVLANDTASLGAYCSKVESDVNMLSQAEFGIVYGSESMRTLSVLRQNARQGENAFVYQSPCDSPQAPANCTTFANGIFHYGIHRALIEYIEITRDLNSLLRSVPRPMSPNETLSWLSQVDMVEFEQFDVSFLQKGLLQNTTDEMVSLVKRSTSWYITFGTAYTISFVVLLVLAYLTVYGPLVKTLGQDVKSTRVMLLIIPSEVIQNVMFCFHCLL